MKPVGQPLWLALFIYTPTTYAKTTFSRYSVTQAQAAKHFIYIDGFNLYYGAIHKGPHKWLNLQRYFEMLRQGDSIQQIHYFTALVNGPTRLDQEVYLRALATLPLVNVVMGKFKAKQITCTVSACTLATSRLFTTQEEKRTDVNIAINMLNDAYQDRCDRFVIVSGDSDLVPALNMVTDLFPQAERRKLNLAHIIRCL